MHKFVRKYLNWRVFLITILWAAVPILAAQVLLADELPAGRPGFERCGCSLWMTVPVGLRQGSSAV